MIHVTKNKHIAFARIGDLQIIVYADRPRISNDDLREFVQAASKNYALAGPITAVLVYSRGTRLNSLQRSLLTDAAKAINLPIIANAVITNSLIMRSTIAIMSWVLNIRIGGFPPTKVSEALAWLAKYCSFSCAAAELAIDQLLAAVY